MPDLKDILLATIPTILPSFMVGFGILINKNDINRLHADIVRVEATLNSRIDGLSKQLSDAIVMLVNIGNELDKRITRIEDKR